LLLDPHWFASNDKTRTMATNLAHASRKSTAMGPSVRNLLAHYQIDPSRITSTGPHQTLLKGDVLSYISQNKLSPGNDAQRQQATTQTGQPGKAYVPNLDLSGHQPKPGPEGFSKIAKRLLDM
jgi:pyruvate/2-oxoglutarate dehydrogenase complex dihydrolipoamide acyltransferase (E2) component